MLPVTINVLEKEYRVACREDEREALLASAEFLNLKMREIRDSGRVVGIERIAVMTALNLANELLQYQTDQNRQKETMHQRLGSLVLKIESVLSGARQINL